MYKIGDMIFYPMHGAGVIEDIVSKDILGEIKMYFVVNLPCTSMSISVPRDKIDLIGIRKIISKDEADAIIEKLQNHDAPVKENWNMRYRENLDKVMKNDIFEIGKVVKELTEREKIKPLSTGERKMLSSAKNIFLSEIALALGKTYDQAEEIFVMGSG